jgi:hypothetical protein
MRLCAVSVDLDEIPNYHAIHGLAGSDAEGRTAVYDRALGRFDELSRVLDVPLTLFAVGADCLRDEARAALRRMAERGHEIGNHTLDHRYDLVRLPRDEMRRQIEAGASALERATGARPVGFRAPGYTVSDALFDLLESTTGVRYDSSVFPCPSYWAAKAAALGAYRLARRRSQSMLDTPLVLLAPRRPYRVGRPYFRRGAGLLELPIQVTRGPRLAFIGTTLVLAGPRRARTLARLVVGEPLVNLELHGIDLLDCRDGLGALGRHQLDVRVPLERKQEALAAAIDELQRAGYAFVQLREAAERLETTA